MAQVLFLFLILVRVAGIWVEIAAMVLILWLAFRVGRWLCRGARSSDHG